MADRQVHLTDDLAGETAEAVFRRIARRKLIERGFPQEQIEQKVSHLLERGTSMRIDIDDILAR